MTLIAVGNNSTNHLVHYDQRISRSYYYRPWWIQSHTSRSHQIAQFCKKSKKQKDPVSTPTPPAKLAVPSSKSLRRTKKDQRTTTINTANAVNNAAILVTSSEQSNQRSSQVKKDEPHATLTNSTTSIKVKDATIEPLLLFAPIYVHPLSQLVLQCLQTNCHDWILSKHLHQNLQLRRDGTFILDSCNNNINNSNKKIAYSWETSKPPPPSIDNTMVGVMKPILQQPSVALPLQYSNKISKQLQKNIKIWTTYETTERKHFLCVSIDPELLYHRYLLQDNNLTPWQGFKIQSSVPERIHSCVYELIHTVNAFEQKVK
jgi:hypothetical protein